MSLIVLLFNLIGPTTIVDHPFHVSVTEIVHKSKSKTLQVSVRLFLDDLELALRHQSGNEMLDIVKTDSALLNQYIEQYVSSKLTLKTKRPLKMNYLGFEYDRDVLWCYLEVSKVRTFDEIHISNSLLTEVYRSQENLVHVRKNDETKSLRFSSDKTEGSVNWKE